MAIIKISDFSKEAASKTKGLILKEKLLEHLDDADLAVDFTGIEMFASPFFNNFGRRDFWFQLFSAISH